MIAPLRRRHRWMTALLGVVVLGLYVAALAGRPAAPLVGQLPAELVGAGVGEVVDEYSELFTHPITTRVRSSAAGWQVELAPREPLARPEVLVYWAPPEAETSATSSTSLPSDAYLIGALAGIRERAMQLPEAALGRPGRLLLYSLGHQEIVDSASLPAIGTPMIEPVVIEPAVIEPAVIEPGAEPTDSADDPAADDPAAGDPAADDPATDAEVAS